jgi:hypothetical protein
MKEMHAQTADEREMHNITTKMLNWSSRIDRTRSNNKATAMPSMEEEKNVEPTNYSVFPSGEAAAGRNSTFHGLVSVAQMVAAPDVEELVVNMHDDEIKQMQQPAPELEDEDLNLPSESNGDPMAIFQHQENNDNDKIIEDNHSDNEGEDDKDKSNNKNSKRKVKKRPVGSPSTSIKQMKDAVVRTQAVIAASKVATIQAMTSYATDKQATNNPRSHTVLVNFDEIVQRPDKMGDGERTRDVPMWTLLLPDDLDTKDFGAELEKLGKAMQMDVPKPRKGKKKKKTSQEEVQNDFEVTICRQHCEYLTSIYGPTVNGSSKKRKIDQEI